MTKEEKILRKKMRRNLKVYYIYKACSWDLLFFYAISFLFLNQYKGLNAASIIFADAFYPMFKILFQLPCITITEKFGKRSALIIANLSLIIYVLFILGCNATHTLIISNIFMAIGFVLKSLCESNIVYDSLPRKMNKQKAFAKIDGISSALYYLMDGISCAISGYLYTINPNFPIIICLIFAIIAFVVVHFFTEVPKDVDNFNERHTEYKGSVQSFKQYIRDLKNAFKLIFSSKRLKSLIYYNAIFIAIIHLLISYRRSLLSEIGLNSEQIGLIFAGLSLISGLGSILANKINKTLKNRTLTYFGLYYSISIFISGLVVILNIPFSPMLAIILGMLFIQFIIKGPYYTLIKQYLSSFASSTMRLKIITASNLIEGIGTGIVSFFAAWLLTLTDTAHASILIGGLSFIIIIGILEYMKTRVGLDPDSYPSEEVNFKEVE